MLAVEDLRRWSPRSWPQCRDPPPWAPRRPRYSRRPRRGDLVIPELDPELIRPAAVSLRLGKGAYVLASHRPVDVTEPATYPDLVPRPVDSGGCLVVHPGEVLLARTWERVGISERLAGLLDGTSDLARLGVSVVLSTR